TFRARVMRKSEMKTWSNQRRSAMHFNCLLRDETGDIRAGGFGAPVAQYYDLLIDNQVYYISNATIKEAKEAFNKGENDYEMSFGVGTDIVPVCVRGVPLMSLLKLTSSSPILVC
ncbi:hypothetical protein BDK51DRAFT_15374, partial [Blyttiomyces helicus]